MNNDFDFERNVITLDLDDGSQVVCEVMAIFSAGDYEYIALLPEKEIADGEVLIYRFFEAEDGSPILENIETDEEFELVAEAFDELQDEWEYDELGLEDPYEDELFEEDEE